MTPEYGTIDFRTTQRQHGKKKNVTIPLTTCTDRQIKKALEGAQAFEKLDTAAFICPPEDFAFELGGNFYDTESVFAYAQLDIKPCEPTATQKCASKEDTEHFRRYGTLKVFYKDVQADLNNISMTRNVPFR
jgi:hypothetical protein